MNERITEAITKELVYKTYNKEEIVFDEQISSIKGIKKLLGNQKPDFIIYFKDNQDNLNIIVIIECKADTKKQEEANSQAKKYAKSLKSKYNVFYYGISGQNNQRNLIEGRLWIKNNQQPFPDKYKKLLKYQDIKKEIYKLTNSSNRFNYDSLKIFKEFNKKLYKMGIPSSERPVLVGCFLISLLGNVNICDNNNEYLKNIIITAAKNKLKKIDHEKREDIGSHYNRLLSNAMWTSQEEVDSYGNKIPNNNLVYFLTELKEKIMPFIHSDQWDVMGTFYREFIKYVTEDKQTGLVLTPPHITDFFCELADIQSSDIVLDPCCGTGGFLIAAMKYMCQKAKNEKQIEVIKTKQLLGIEKRKDMWLHASVNMMMHGDGHTNIFYGDCFKFKIDNFKHNQPTVVFLNPPYNEPSEQLRFIQKALELTTPKGQVIAIVQASATGQSTAVNNAKKEILNNHTLLASFSCPKELFHGIAGVITNILIFAAHVPHDSKKNTFLGWFKDDGFIKQKNKRIEKNWKLIKDKWIDIYRNKKEVKETNIESKMQTLTHEDEWCIEAYLKPELPSQKDFMLIIKEYILHEFEVLLDNEIN
ncbi:Restriction enzyme alpha subunit [Candidatus Phytoplasma australiense]|uniref:site-specific DNA-methyltransferase (adenine-specific) n=1 Tax=Phytoplasma australiense TaxID=59748 RepID=B1VA00_PHYAS|nr:Restriction enzyme alpha subunit [Candidatus Phytoplasma australiense]